jgi:MFS family permease
LSDARRAAALAPFRIRSYRFQWTSDLATSWAFEMESIILGWYILTETGSVLLLTVYASLQFLGTLFAPMFGMLGDRLGHRNLLCAMRAFYALLSTVLMIFAFTGWLTPGYVLFTATLFGIVRPSDQVMRLALVGGTMPPDLLMGAMSTSRTTQDSARIFGALVGATLVTILGMGPAYIIVAGFYALSFGLTFGITGGRLVPADVTDGMSARPSPWRGLAIAADYIWTTPYVLALMCLACLVNLTAFPLLSTLMPYVAKEVYRVDQTVLGYLVAILALGQLCGSIALSNSSGLFRPARIMIVCCIAWHLSILILAQFDHVLIGAALLFAAGFLQSLVMVPMAAVLVRSSDPQFRGRVMGLRAMVVYSLPVGLLISGPLINHFGYRATASLYCLVGLGFTLLIAGYWRRHLWVPESPANARF